MMERVRVVAVDDSAFARNVLRSVLTSDPRIELVEVARDGLDALEKIAATKPDVVTLDLVMPQLDGLAVLRALSTQPNAPHVIVVSISDASSALGVEALASGAFDLVAKPTALATSRLFELAGPLVSKVLAAAEARRNASRRPPRPAAPPIAPAVARNKRPRAQLVVVGTSTGGPQALTRLLHALPGDFPAPIAIALHIPEGYTRSMAERLDAMCALTVREAEDGIELVPGLAVIAPGGRHMHIERGADGRLRGRVRDGGEDLYVPSVDRLFDSAADAAGDRLLAVVLTGMGNDGLRGATKVRELGGAVVSESEASCVVYGMPRAIAEAQLSMAEASVDEMANLLTTFV